MVTGTLPVSRPPDWTVDALCAQVDPELHFPDKGGTTRPAKAVCALCPVAADCLQYALDNQERFGIWGGTSERDRRKLLATGRGLEVVAALRARPPAPPVVHLVPSMQVEAPPPAVVERKRPAPVVYIQRKQSQAERAAQRTALYRDGLTDAEIAKQQQVTPASIYLWRRRNNLPANTDPERMQRRMELYRQGLTDAEVGAKEGRSPKSVQQWRRRNNLPANVPPGWWRGSDRNPNGEAS